MIKLLHLIPVRLDITNRLIHHAATTAIASSFASVAFRLTLCKNKFIEHITCDFSLQNGQCHHVPSCLSNLMQSKIGKEMFTSELFASNKSLYFLLFQNTLTDLEVFACLISAIIHDYDHSGTTNNYHINSSSNLALLYNDRAVLENHHVSAFFK